MKAFGPSAPVARDLTLTADDRFQGLAPARRRWLSFEQTVNDRIVNDRIHTPIDARSNTVRAIYRPDSEPVWTQSVVWLPTANARSYGPLSDTLSALLGVDTPARRCPLMLHPQTPPAHRALASDYGISQLTELKASPTASYRTVAAWDGLGHAGMLKLSIGAVIGRVRRLVREVQVARATLMTAVMATVPEQRREQFGLDWFGDLAGMVETRSGHGWLLRTFPERVGTSADTTLVPAFSLISRRGTRGAFLLDQLAASGMTPEAFVADALIRPYVRAIAYLLFAQGIQVEGHSQNVLFEVDAQQRLTRRLALRDLADASVSIPMRLARGLPFPMLPKTLRPRTSPFPLASVATDYVCNFERPVLNRAVDTVERYGYWGFVWPINRVLTAALPRHYDPRRITRLYLRLWQDAAMRYLSVRPLFLRPGPGLATDEASAAYLERTDWRARGATPRHALPAGAEALLITSRARPRSGRVYDRLECEWGDLFLFEGRPVFFAPAH